MEASLTRAAAGEFFFLWISQAAMESQAAVAVMAATNL